MHECPHCHQQSISHLHKLMAVHPLTATCPQCHELCNLHVVYALSALTLWIVITWAFIGLALFFGMSFLVLGTIPALMLAVDRYMLQAPLRPVRSSI